MKLLTKEQQESYENAKLCYICKEKFENKYVEDAFEGLLFSFFAKFCKIFANDCFELNG